MNIKIHILLVFYVIVTKSEAEEKCRFSKCNECISSIDDCIWCSQKQMTSEQTTRCMPRSHQNVSSSWCDSKEIQESNANKQIYVPGITDFNKTVQLQPRRIKIKARPGYETKFSFYYKPAEDYPLDVYFLIDISNTMKSKLQVLKGQADQIYTQLTTYSNNVRLGIGSFIEKPGLPYVDKRNSDDQSRAHAFKHHLSLTNNTNNFKSTITNIRFGGNYDDPEAGLDGLMQAMTCIKELGWRSGARRIIVLCTDSTYHSAGDGKIVGAIKPNDMKCHLNKNNVYDEALALTYDYPSISQINKIAIEGQFTIVFAVASRTAEVYKKIVTQIKGAKYATLEHGTEAVEIIKEAYRINAIEPSVTLEQWPSFLEMPYGCGTKKCESTPENRIVEITGKLTIKQCPDDKKFKREHSFGIFGITEKITIELDIDCQCECEKTSGVPDSICKNDGLLQCGICNCINPASYGINCQCSSNSTDTKHDDKCKLTETDKPCSGKGICECGKCVKCDDGYSGDYCEYYKDACPKNGGQLCSDKGNCDRGKCVCKTHWTGADCSCLLNTDACMAPYSKNVCSGNGICTCGKCECAANGTYSGTYCDVCDDCAEKRCKELQDYVHCNIENNTKLCDELYNTTDTTVTFKNETELNELKWSMAQLCEIHFKNDSKIIFKYQYNDRKLELGIQGLVSPPEVNLFVAVGSAIGAVLLIGILTLIVWKILIDLHDKREYEKFSEESKAAGYDVTFNPLFIEAEVSFPNPTFERTD